MINKITLLFLFTLGLLCTVSAQNINFEWDTAIDNGDNVSETINGVTVTVSGIPDLQIIGCGNCFGTTGSFVGSLMMNETSITFTFNEPVSVNSILATDGNGENIDYTFTPIGGDNSVIVASLISGTTPVSLNWTDVTSFTVTSTGSSFGFDDLSIREPSLSINDYTISALKIYPNPVKKTLFLSNIENLISIKTFNSLGQLVMETDKIKIDFSNLDNGIFFLQITTLEGIEVRKILKE